MPAQTLSPLAPASRCTLPLIRSLFHIIMIWPHTCDSAHTNRHVGSTSNTREQHLMPERLQSRRRRLPLPGYREPLLPPFSSSASRVLQVGGADGVLLASGAQRAQCRKLLGNGALGAPPACGSSPRGHPCLLAHGLDTCKKKKKKHVCWVLPVRPLWHTFQPPCASSQPPTAAHTSRGTPPGPPLQRHLPPCCPRCESPTTFPASPSNRAPPPNTPPPAGLLT